MSVKRLHRKYTKKMSGIPPALLTAAVTSITTKRLSSYRKFFGATDDAELFGLYCWNETVSSLLFRAIGLTEIAMRNQFHRALSKHYGGTGAPESRDWYDFISLGNVSADKIFKIRHKKSRAGKWLPVVPQPTPDDVVAKLTFGFWPYLLDVRKDKLGNLVDWGLILPDIVVGHRQTSSTYWSKQAEQDELFARMDLINELRNRIAHHEPVWKAGALLSEERERSGKKRTVVVAAPKTPQEALDRLRLVYERTLEFLGWCSPALRNAHVQSKNHAEFLVVVSMPGLDAYRRGPRLQAELDISAAKKLGDLKRAIKRLKRNGSSALLKNGKNDIGFLQIHT